MRTSDLSGRFAYRAILIICLWVAFLVRVWGVDFGLPYEFHPDEHKYVDEALNWHLTGETVVRAVNPPLFTYVLVGAYWFWLALSPFEHAQAWVTSAYLFARLWSVSFGVLTIALVYRLGKQVFNSTAGLLAAVFMAVLFLPAREAHFAVNDTALAFFVLMALYFSVGLYQRNKLAHYLLAGLAVGLATATKLTGGVAVVALLTAHLFAVANRSGSFFHEILNWKNHTGLLFGVGAAVATFVLISPNIILNFVGFLGEVQEHMQFGAEGYKGLRMSPSNGWGFYARVLGWGMGWLMLVAAAIAIGIVFFRRHRTGIIVAAIPLTLFLYVGAQKILFARFLLPALPPLVILAAFGLTWLGARFGLSTRNQMLLLWFVAGVMVVQPVANLVWFDHLLTLADTRDIATRWFTKQFPEDTVVAWESYTILPQVVYLHDDWPYKRIHLDEQATTQDDVDYYVSHKTQVIAVSNYVFDRVRQDPIAERARQARLAFLEEKAELIKTFDPYRETYDAEWFYMDQLYGPAGETLQRVRPGPLIKLYRLPDENQPYSTEMPDIPVPVNANFAGKLMLLGYDLPVRRAEAGGSISITLYWQAMDRMKDTYVIFDHLLDKDQRNWGGYDRWPRETANTSLWRPGEIVIDSFNIPIDADAPDGVYMVDVGLYIQADPAANPLPLVSDGQPIDQNSVSIGPVKIGGPPVQQTVSLDEATPQEEAAVQLGDPPVISFRGYDAALHDNALTLSLYWESLAQTAVDWSTFVHIRDETGTIVVQQDGPAGSGEYPASLWDAGEVIRDEVRLPLEEFSPGQYEVVLGLYDLRNGQRLSVESSADGVILLQSFEVGQ